MAVFLYFTACTALHASINLSRMMETKSSFDRFPQPRDAAAPTLQPLPLTPTTVHMTQLYAKLRIAFLDGSRVIPSARVGTLMNMNRKLMQETPPRREAECSLHDAEANYVRLIPCAEVRSLISHHV